MTSLPDFDVNKFYLGKICARNHYYKNTTYCLRLKSNQGCIECKRLTDRKYAKRPGLTTTPKEDLFWSYVDKNSQANNPDDCWTWIAGKDRDGYGAFALSQHKKVKAHRYSYLLTYGDLPSNMHVCHKCDNPTCVRPDHLFLGTDADNIKDMMDKQRNVVLRGSKSGRAKLTEDQVEEVKKFIGILSPKELAEKFSEKYNVAKGTIDNITYNRTWKHI